MKPSQQKITIIGVALLVILVVVILVVSTSESSSEDFTHPTIENAVSLYTEAINVLDNTNNLSMQISYKKETLLGKEFLTEQSVQTVTYEGLTSGPLRANATEKLIVGNHTTNLSEIFADDQLYLTIDDCRFYGDMNSETYLSRYTPVQTINSSLYNTITGEDTGKGYKLYFSDPTHIESWVNAKDTDFKQAAGTVSINKDGQLTGSNYSASYSVNDLIIRVSVSVQITYENLPSVTLPADADEYTKLTTPDAPRLLEKACGYLLDASDIQATLQDSIFCEAFGDKRNQTIMLETIQDTTWSAQVDTTVEIINSSKAGSTTNYTQKEIFSDNTYSISVDAGEPTVNNNIDVNAMRNYCHDLLVSTILLPDYITGATITESEDIYTIELTGNDTFAQLIDAEACATLYNDAHVLSSIAQSFAVEKMQCYLTISKSTGLPVSSGLDYLGVHTIESFPYRLQFHADHNYILLNQEAGA